MDAIVIVILLFLIQMLIVKVVSRKFKVLSESYLWVLFSLHSILTATYAFFAFLSRSDAFGYYKRSSTESNWFHLWGTSTTFIDFLAWPITHFLGLSFLSAMFIFSYLGYLGIMFFYIVARENISLKNVWKNYTPIELIFLLPNLHYWSSSLGKGSVILFGLGLFIFGLSRFNRRYITLIFGSLIVYMVRPPVLFTAIFAVMISTLLTNKGIKIYLRWIIFAISLAIVLFIFKNIAEFTQVEDLDVLNSDIIETRAFELGKARSGIDLKNYSLPMKMFTFWFRPLFFDGLGGLGLIVSFENAFYIYMFWVVLFYGSKSWKNWNGWFRICLFFFLLGSVAMAQITGNLGIAIRQKSQIMPFFFIAYFKALQYKEKFKRIPISRRIAKK